MNAYTLLFFAEEDNLEFKQTTQISQAFFCSRDSVACSGKVNRLLNVTEKKNYILKEKPKQ